MQALCRETLTPLHIIRVIVWAMSGRADLPPNRREGPLAVLALGLHLKSSNKMTRVKQEVYLYEVYYTCKLHTSRGIHNSNARVGDLHEAGLEV